MSDDKIYGIDKALYQSMIDMTKDSPDNFFNMGLGNVMIANADIKTESGTSHVIFLKTSRTVQEILNPPTQDDFRKAVTEQDPEWTVLQFPTSEQRNLVSTCLERTWSNIEDDLTGEGLIPFDQWMSELNTHYQANNTDGHEYTPDYADIENCSWHNYYLDGLTPQEALNEDFSYA